MESGRRQIARRYVIRGRVQGVGFRFFVYRRAAALGVGGWVRNLPNGDVEAHVEGVPDLILKLEALLRSGPSFAYVSEVEWSAVEPEGLDSFSIER